MIIPVVGLTLGITATDILFHLGKEEISFPPRSGDRLRRLASHLLQQRSFYPLYPPNDEINLDMEQLENMAGLEVKPDVLILPSDLLHFFKVGHAGFVFVHVIFGPKKKMFAFSRAHSHALTNAKNRHEYFRGLSRLLPVTGVLVSFLELRFLGKMALLALRRLPQPLKKPSQVQNECAK